MISGIDLNQVVDFILPEDKENPTIWKLGILPSYVLSRLSTPNTDIDKIDVAFKLLQLTIKGWENFNGIEYKSVKEVWFGREVQIVPLELIERLDMRTITLLSTKILEINHLTSEERKN